MSRPLMCITGANGQVGSYLAREYQAEGYPLLLLYHQRTERIAELMHRNPSLKVDMRDLAALQKGVGEILGSTDTGIGILIHTAALRSYDALPLGDTDPQTYHHIFETNFYSAYNILRTSLPMMQKVKWGRVVLFGSDVSAKGLALGSAYAAAKAAMANLARSAAREYAASGILINTISPAPVDTDLGSDYQDHYLEFRQRYFAQYLQSSATGKLISLPELKTVVDMLINPLLESLCGEEIFLRGGII